MQMRDVIGRTLEFLYTIIWLVFKITAALIRIAWTIPVTIAITLAVLIGHEMLNERHH